MVDFQIVQSFKSSNDLNQIMPDLLLRKILLRLFPLRNQIQNISSIRILHNNTQSICWVFKKGIFITDDIRVLDTGEDANLIQSVLFLIIG